MKPAKRESGKIVIFICVAIFLAIIVVPILFVSCNKKENKGHKNPTTTETPTITSKNEVTNTPVPTETVEPTENPERTPTPVPTDVVDVTESPKKAATDKPDPTEAPKPTATKKPDPTATPKPTSTPKPTASAGKEVLLDVVAEGQGTTFESGSGIMVASMVLKYYGINVDLMRLYACMAKVDSQREDVTPWEYSIGAPEVTVAMYYAPVIKNMMNTYLSNNGITNIKAKDITGCEPNDIYNNVLNGNPVIIVANWAMKPKAESGRSWTLPSGETFTWKLETSFFVITGVNGSEVTFISGMSGEIYTFDKSVIEASFKAYESQAIIIE